MLRRRARHPVLAEIPARRGDSSRPAFGRPELEAFSQLAGALDGSRAVLATGPARSAVALGLATVATAKGSRVALLECDLAAPSLASALGLDPTPGLHEYLRGDADTAQVLQPLTLAGPASGGAGEPLVCVVAGVPEPAPDALLDSDRCDQAIQSLREAYDLLAIVGPSLEKGGDALPALAEHADATVVCGGRGEIPRRLPVPIAGSVILG
jgi:hypothetical protein